MSDVVTISESITPSESQSFPREAQAPALISAESAGEQFLRLHLVPDTTVLLPVQQLTEVLNLAIAQITPIPHMPAWVMGVYNWRGEILWMVDLGHLCGLTPWYQQPGGSSVYPVALLQATDSDSAQAHTLGLVVNRVEDIEWCDPNQIQAVSSSSIVSDLSRFLRGYWWKPDDSTLAVLDGKLILAAMPKP